MNDSYMVVCSDCFSGGEEYTIGFLTPRKCEKCGSVSESVHAEPIPHQPPVNPDRPQQLPSDGRSERIRERE